MNPRRRLLIALAALLGGLALVLLMTDTSSFGYNLVQEFELDDGVRVRISADASCDGEAASGLYYEVLTKHSIRHPRHMFALTDCGGPSNFGDEYVTLLSSDRRALALLALPYSEIVEGMPDASKGETWPQYLALEELVLYVNLDSERGWPRSAERRSSLRDEFGRVHWEAWDHTGAELMKAVRKVDLRDLAHVKTSDIYKLRDLGSLVSVHVDPGALDGFAVAELERRQVRYRAPWNEGDGY